MVVVVAGTVAVVNVELAGLGGAWDVVGGVAGIEVEVGVGTAVGGVPWSGVAVGAGAGEGEGEGWAKAGPDTPMRLSATTVATVANDLVTRRATEEVLVVGTAGSPTTKNATERKPIREPKRSILTFR
jgi:hypothetical protein